MKNKLANHQDNNLEDTIPQKFLSRANSISNSLFGNEEASQFLQKNQKEPSEVDSDAYRKQLKEQFQREFNNDDLRNKAPSLSEYTKNHNVEFEVLSSNSNSKKESLLGKRVSKTSLQNTFEEMKSDKDLNDSIIKKKKIWIYFNPTKSQPKTYLIT